VPPKCHQVHKTSQLIPPPTAAVHDRSSVPMPMKVCLAELANSMPPIDSAQRKDIACVIQDLWLQVCSNLESSGREGKLTGVPVGGGAAGVNSIAGDGGIGGPVELARRHACIYWNICCCCSIILASISYRCSIILASISSRCFLSASSWACNI
jgi:hypothetical protein